MNLPLTRYPVMRKKRKVKSPPDKNIPLIKVQLDYKTIITIRSLDVLSIWKEKYPNLEVIS